VTRSGLPGREDTNVAEEKTLSGWPKKRLVKEVRSHLWSYGIRPTYTVWHATWSWANAIAKSYYHTSWPIPSEIGHLYVFLLLGHMNQYHGLKLPYRASKVVPEEVRKLLTDTPFALPNDNDRRHRPPLKHITHEQAE
jgi:hypothetical protein